MRTPPRSLLLIVKERHPSAAETGQRMVRWLDRHGVRTRLVSSLLDPSALREAGEGMDAALVLGGDGGMLGAARGLLGANVPLLGVNFGRVGFLAEIDAQNWEPAFTRLMKGEYQEQRCTALAWSVFRAAGEPAASSPSPSVTPLPDTPASAVSGWAVNDVVLARGAIARAVSLELSVDGVPLSRVRCDGIICSAPLGATAYAASARGPLVSPSLDALLVTPVCPFAGAFPPLTLPAPSRILLVAGDDGGDVHLTVDGQQSLALEPGDSLTVRGVPGQVRLLVSDPAWYLRRLGERGFIQPGPGRYTSAYGVSHAGV